jgi:hypothetical protein
LKERLAFKCVMDKVNAGGRRSIGYTSSMWGVAFKYKGGNLAVL